VTDSRRLPDLDAIRDALKRSRRGPMKPKELARALDLPREEYRKFRELLRELEARGDLYRNRGNRYAVPGRIHLVVGELRVTRSGDAFLVPDEPGETDVFVAARHQESAMDGDRVVVRVEGRPPGRNPVGRVVKILERARPTVVGRYHRSRKFGFIRPLDRRVSRDVLIPEGSEGEADEGDVVLVRITQFGSPTRNAVGEVDLVLGPLDQPGVDVLAILHGHGLPRAFPTEVEAEAAQAEERLREPGLREDHRELLVFTIDPADARDHDDALSIRSLGGGLHEVGIHIADVSHFVPEGSALDLEALKRGTSVYLVDQVVPMLPHGLSSHLCSLGAGEDRLALSLFVSLDGEGKIREHRMARTWIRSRHSLDYHRVQRVLEGEDTVDAETDAALAELNRLAGALRARRRARGSLDFDLPETRVVLDDEGIPMDIQRVVSLDSHRLIEDFMLLANEVVAREVVARELPIPYRVHEPPTSDRLEELREFLRPFGHVLPQKRVKPRKLQQILDQVRGHPEETLISTVVLRSMNRARYASDNLGHFGLASDAYLHFTSPIRRYPDLVVHRVVTRVILEGAPPLERWTDALGDVADRSSERERLAQQAERDSVEMKKIEYMRRHLGDHFDGTVAGVTAFGFFVLLDQVFVEGLVHVSNLEDDYYTFVPEAYALVGDRTGRRFRIGDRVQVQVVRADKEERQIDFLLVSGPEGAAAMRSDGDREAGRRGDGGGLGGGGGRKGRGGKGKGGGRKGRGRGRGGGRSR
jgi:ribonuclease R